MSIRVFRKHFAWTAVTISASVLAIDQWLKGLVSFGSLRFSTSWLVVAPHFNEGLLGGMFSDLHPWIIRIFFSVLFGFIALLVSLLLYFLRHKDVPRLKYGIVLYVSGILGNVWDRAISGRITDFLIVNLPLLRHYAFNFADLVLAAGLALIVGSLTRDQKQIWFAQNQRRSLIIESRFQVGLSIFLVFMAAMNALIIATYSYTFLRVYLNPSSMPVSASSRVIRDYLIGLGIIEIGFLLITLGVGLIFSHRMAGPIYAFERYIERVFAAKDPGASGPFRLRNMDYFKSLEKTAQQIVDGIRNLK